VPLRLGVRRDGLVVYRVKNAGRGRVKQRVMSPVECLARLAAMVPPPRYPFFGCTGACAAPPMASARGAAPARIAGRMQLVVIQEKEEHELRGSGESLAYSQGRG